MMVSSTRTAARVKPRSDGRVAGSRNFNSPALEGRPIEAVAFRVAVDVDDAGRSPLGVRGSWIDQEGARIARIDGGRDLHPVRLHGDGVLREVAEVMRGFQGL